MFKVALLGVGAAILSVWVKGVKPEYGVWIILSTGVLLGICVVEKLEVLVEGMQVIQAYFSGYATYMKLLVKIIGITYLSEIASDLCKDAGAGSLAVQIELFGKLSILFLCLPVISSLLETMEYVLGS